MELKKLYKLCINTFCIFIIALLLFWAVSGSQLSWRAGELLNVNIDSAVGEIDENIVITEILASPVDEIEVLNLYVGTYNRKNSGILSIQILNQETNDILQESYFDIATFTEDTKINIIHTPIKGVKEEKLELRITSASKAHQSITLYSSISQNNTGMELFVNGESVGQTLTMELYGGTAVNFRQHFFIFSIIVVSILALYLLYLIRYYKLNKKSIGLNIATSFYRYNFLLKQLISRDFKTKYKRSVLGVFWSFLNPLLTMIVQYIVFSMLFKQDIENFPVYLLTGVIFFNFFSEACTLGLGAITDNTSLITKVYVPKYIFPISRIGSSLINLLISFVPLFVVILLTGTSITPQFILVIYSIVCATIFCAGIVFLLSSIMVFFRDIRFIWSVVITLWMYATPIFYPENIISPQFQMIIKLNPMRHFIQFAREVILYGRSPVPVAYFYCFISAIITFIIGITVFKKTKNKFILYI